MVHFYSEIEVEKECFYTIFALKLLKQKTAIFVYVKKKNHT